MYRSRLDTEIYSKVACMFGLETDDVRRIVLSFFDDILVVAKKYPFNNPRKIYSRAKFDSIVTSYVACLPCLGRLGPSYTRYIKWRSNVAIPLERRTRKSCREESRRDEIENIAASIFSGKTPCFNKSKKGSELFDNVWLVGTDGKKLARQVIKKRKNA